VLIGASGPGVCWGWSSGRQGTLTRECRSCDRGTTTHLNGRGRKDWCDRVVQMKRDGENSAEGAVAGKFGVRVRM
jgi:hypothetical protein